MFLPPAVIPNSIADSIPPARNVVSLSARWFVALLAGWLAVVSTCLELQAGCSSISGSPAQVIESKPAPTGQLTLAMYVRYERGSLSFTLERPVRPCNGPSCSSKPSMEPTLLPVAAYRPMVTQAANSIVRFSSSGSSSGSYARPSSQYAPRGSLEVCEPPPKDAN